MPILSAHENGSREPDKKEMFWGVVRESKAPRINSSAFLCDSTIRGIDLRAGVYEQAATSAQADCAQLGERRGGYALGDCTFVGTTRETGRFPKGSDLHGSIEITQPDEAWLEERLWDPHVGCLWDPWVGYLWDPCVGCPWDAQVGCLRDPRVGCPWDPRCQGRSRMQSGQVVCPYSGEAKAVWSLNPRSQSCCFRQESTFWAVSGFLWSHSAEYPGCYPQAPGT